MYSCRENKLFALISHYPDNGEKCPDYRKRNRLPHQASMAFPLHAHIYNNVRTRSGLHHDGIKQQAACYVGTPPVFYFLVSRGLRLSLW